MRRLGADGSPDVDTTPLLLAWVAANGLWIAESTNILTVTPAQRTALLGRLTELTKEISA